VTDQGPLAAAWLGRVGYRAAWELQEALRARILDGAAAEWLLLLEHEPVITLGKSARAGHVLAGEAALAARGVERVASSRGGDVTYHGPGQLVAYPVVRLARGVLAHVEAMGRAVCETAAELGVQARFERAPTGVWVGDESTPRKLAAFGVHVRRRVAIHGLALNATTDLSAFDLIVPCGLAGAAVTSLEREAGRSPAPAELARPLGAALARAFGRPLSWIEPGLPAVRSALLSGSRSVE
jgi:lipoyl(octanoyl) transferase